jgi:ATP-dependent helicase IRC3
MRNPVRFFSSLRDYQQECIEKSLLAWKSGLRRIAVSLPVGSGKTIIFSHLIKSLQGDRKILVLAHRKELLTQAATQIQRICPELVGWCNLECCSGHIGSKTAGEFTCSHC